jgi:hypothetical protein
MKNLMKKKTLVVGDFFNRKSFCSLLLQVVCDSEILFGMLMVGN